MEVYGSLLQNGEVKAYRGRVNVDLGSRILKNIRLKTMIYDLQGVSCKNEGKEVCQFIIDRNGELEMSGGTTSR